MGYKTPAALEMAVKEAAKASSLDTNRAITGFYFHRLLCRVFADDNESFVLKGGQGMLARTVDARATCDIDLLSKRNSLDNALAELRLLAEIDLGDFITFEYAGSAPIKAEDEYRSGLAVRFVPLLGAKRIQAISIDLVVDGTSAGDAERITPADRISVGEIEVCDYLVYSVESALADKFCAIIERHGGRSSSRVKDLVDIIIYVTTCDIDGDKLQEHLRKEISVRKFELPASFVIPEEWAENYEKVFARLCVQTGIPQELQSFGTSVALARRIFDPALKGDAGAEIWLKKKLNWSPKEKSEGNS